MFGIGEHAIGGFPDADSFSVPDPLPGLLADESLSREFLLRALPSGIQRLISDSGSTLITDDGMMIITDSRQTEVDLSSSGYTSHPSDIPYKNFPSAVSRPYNFNVELPLPDLCGGASLGAGEILIKNSDGSLDGEATADWLGADIDVYIGNKIAPLNQFTGFYKGKSAGVSWDLDSFAIIQRDMRFKLQKRLQQHRYTGHGACLRFDGTDYVTTTLQSPPGNMALRARVRPSATPADVSVNDFSNGAVSTRSLRLIGRQPYFEVRNDAGTLYTVTAPDQIPLDEWSDIAGVLDASNLKIGIVVNGVETAFTVISGVYNNVITTHAIGRTSNTASRFYQGDIDEVSVWNLALSLDEIQKSLHQPLTGAELGCVGLWHYDEGAGTTAGDSSPIPHHGTITGCTWVGSLEGDPAMVGVVKPVVVGVKRQISPKMVDSQRLVFQANDGPMEEYLDVSDSGDSYTFGSDLSDIYSSTPAPGTYNTCLSRGLFRLGSSPIGVILCSVRGDNSSPIGYTDTMSGIHKKVAVQYGGLHTDSLNLDTYATLLLKTQAKIGFYWDTEINVDQALDDIMRQGGFGWWTPDRVSRLSVGRIDDPSTLATDLIVTSDSIVEPKKGGIFKKVPVGVRIGEVVLGYRHYDTTLSEDQVAGTVDLATRNDLGQAYRFVTATDVNRSIDADTMTVYTEIDDPEDAKAEANRLLDLWKVDRAALRITMDQGVLSYFIGSVFEVVVNRYDLSPGKKFIAFGIGEDMGQYGQTDRLEPALFG